MNLSNNNISGVFLYATILGGGIMNLPHSSDNIIPRENHQNTYRESHIEDWNTNKLEATTDFTLPNSSENHKLQTIIDFSRNLMDNSKEIDGEFVDIINENFWDLV